MQKSLFEDTYNAEGLKDAKILEIRKRDIGILCREQLLKYFVDDGTVSTMRRWVSALLFQSSPANEPGGWCFMHGTVLKLQGEL
jgi:hypothetical protein